MQEEGLKGFDVAVWHALYAPKGTPKAALDKLNDALVFALKDEGVKKRFAELGTEPVPPDKATPAYLQKHLASEIAKWGPIIKAAGQYAD
jgi:tripartite-type tricarboxylate transporter receptor subunit TctC